MDWLERIQDFTAQLADAAERGDSNAPVPTCPDWTLADLTWHLLEVQDFWTWIITNRPAGPDDYVQPDRPDPAELPTGLRSACDELIAALVAADPSEPAWSWTDDHTVGFTCRRQAHEAYVHLVDALLTVGGAMPTTTTEFGVDGVDELVTNNLLPIPDWGSFTPGHERLVSLRTTDADRVWTFQFGTFSGTSPNSGTTYVDEPQVQLGEGSPGATASANASSLDLWLWGRAPTKLLQIEGDHALVDELRTVVAGETQ